MIISPFLKKKYECTQCKKIIHESCISKISKNCVSIFNDKTQELGLLVVKFINKYSNNIIDPNNINGTLIIEIHMFINNKKSDILGCMAFKFKELINMIESTARSFLILPKSIGCKSNCLKYSNVMDDLNLLSNKYINNTAKNQVKQNSVLEEISQKDDGIKLEDFKILKVIGRGGFSKVFLSQYIGNLSYSGYFAMKVIRKDIYHENKNFDTLIQERNILSLLISHSFIMQAISCFQTRQYVCFIFDFIDGGDLSFYLNKNGKFNENQAKDLKPENILIQRSGHIKLTDFSISKQNIGNNGRTFTYCGTMQYLPPEVLNNLIHKQFLFGNGFSHDSDWWAFGVLMYLLLTSDFPFRGLTDEALFANIKYNKPLLPDYFKVETKSLLNLLLTKDPIQRLGHGLKGDVFIRTHNYFVCINWNDVRNQKLDPPVLPEINTDGITDNFDEEFTHSLIQLTPPNELVIDKIDNNQLLGIDFTR
ncbi:hypothetical protein MXB_4034 [Myxobolus squamalis]|nr:hypothetical protein MXB_4034 [Myxobolus squamalis]